MVKQTCKTIRMPRDDRSSCTGGKATSHRTESLMLGNKKKTTQVAKMEGAYKKQVIFFN